MLPVSGVKIRTNPVYNFVKSSRTNTQRNPVRSTPLVMSLHCYSLQRLAKFGYKALRELCIPHS